MKCTECGAEGQSPGRMCSSCGKELPEYDVPFQTCISCHAQFDRVLKKCPRCGADNDFNIKVEEPLATYEPSSPLMMASSFEVKVYGDSVVTSADYAVGSRRVSRSSRGLWRAGNITLVAVLVGGFLLEVFLWSITGSLIAIVIGLPFMAGAVGLLAQFLWIEARAREGADRMRRGD